MQTIQLLGKTNGTENLPSVEMSVVSRCGSCTLGTLVKWPAVAVLAVEKTLRSQSWISDGIAIMKSSFQSMAVNLYNF
jgi:hypothetical protein